MVGSSKLLTPNISQNQPPLAVTMSGSISGGGSQLALQNIPTVTILIFQDWSSSVIHRLSSIRFTSNQTAQINTKTQTLETVGMT